MCIRLCYNTIVITPPLIPAQGPTFSVIFQLRYQWDKSCLLHVVMFVQIKKSKAAFLILSEQFQMFLSFNLLLFSR